MRKITTYSIWILLVTVVMAACSGSNKKPLPSLHKTFEKDDVLPFGTKVAYQLIQQAYPGSDIEDFSTESRLTDFNYYDTNFLYICIARNVYATKEDVGNILSSVTNGNTYFISAENISDDLLDTLGIGLYNAHYYFGLQDYNTQWGGLEDTYLRMTDYIGMDTTHYGYFFLPFKSSFTKFDSSSTRVLGVNADGFPDFLVVFYGKGKLFIHCEPSAFSNYFLLQHNNYKYLRNVLAIIPALPQHVYWDDYYVKHNHPKATGSGLAVLLKYPPMKWAFWLALILLLLYIIFGGKRRQRIIPLLSPMKNTTVAYTETISRLYLQKKDNKNIAEKMITFFYEYIRHQFFLNTSLINEAFIDSLSRKSAISKEATEELFKTIASIQQKTTVSDQELLLLNKQIENFFKHRK